MRILIIIAALVGTSCSDSVARPPETAQVERIESLTLPQKCRSLLREPDPSTWDPVKEEYPPNYEWENCMGVGRK